MGKRVVLVFLLLAIIYTYFSVNKKYESIYNGDETIFVGNIKKIKYYDDKIELTILSKERLSGTYYLKGNNDFDIKLNDTIRVIGSLKEASSNRLPNLFNYRDYLYNNKQYYLLNIDNIEKISNNDNSFYKIKNFIISKIKNYKSYKYLYAFVLRDNSYIDDTIRQSYQANGISHLFAVSGMHISFFSAFILGILKKIKLKEALSYLIVSVFLIFYMFLVGFTPSVNRSVILYILIFIKKLFKLKIDTIYLLLTDLSILLIINPFYIYNIGFIYSFVISFFLILYSKQLKSKNQIVSIIKASYISFLASMPITIYSNSEINILSVIYNLFFVPVVSNVIFPLSILTLLFPLLDNFYFILTSILENMSLFLQNISILKIILSKPSIIVVIIYYLSILLSLYKPKNYIVLIVIVILHYNINGIIRVNSVSFLDVGQGDSILIRSGAKVMLVDTGNDILSNNKNIVSYLKSLGIRKIDYIAITHGDMDHLGNVSYIIDYIKTDNVLFNMNEYNSNELEIIEQLKSKNISYKRIEELETLYLNDFKIININKSLRDENSSSIVFLVSIKDYRLLLTGDASIESEEYILNRYNIGNIDVLKVGHHGSKTSTSEELLSKIKPKYAFISVGENNIYKHPNREVLENLEKHKVLTYQSNLDGTCILDFSKKINIKCMNT